MVIDGNRRGVEAAAAQLARGDLIGLPTETVYGLGASARDLGAVASVFEAKARPTFDPLIVHLGPSMELGDTVDLLQLSPDQRRWVAELEQFWPGPLTLVLPRCAWVDDLITAGLDTVAVRRPAHPVAQQILEAFGGPVVAPSANPFGGISPTTAAHVEASFPGVMVVDGGACQVGVESTIVAVRSHGVQLLRPGGVSREDLAERVPLVSGAAVPSEAPGQLVSHYAPGKALVIVDSLAGLRGNDVAVLSWSLAADEVRALVGEVPVEVLCPDGLVTTAAQRLFAALRRLDATSAEQIVAMAVPVQEGLGVAIADRLARASAPKP